MEENDMIYYIHQVLTIIKLIYFLQLGFLLSYFKLLVVNSPVSTAMIQRMENKQLQRSTTPTLSVVCVGDLGITPSTSDWLRNMSRL